MGSRRDPAATVIIAGEFGEKTAMQPIRENHPLKRFFTGLVEQAFFCELGVCDPRLTDYLAELLISFIHMDRLHALRDARGRRLEQIASMLSLLDEGAEPTADDHHRAVHRHIGDYALFWTGVYPEHIRTHRRPLAADHLVNYVAQGKRSYAIASTLTHDEGPPPAALLNRLSRDFECCVHGLGKVRSGWEQSDPQSYRQARSLLY